MNLTSPDQLRAAWQDARARHPMARAFDVAHTLGVSELELVATHLGTPEATRLRPDLPAIFAGLGALGPVMALTRNAHCVIEKHGAWAPYEGGPAVGIVHGDAGALDLRLFLGRWRHALAVRSEAPKGTRRSIQFFDRDGTAIHKVFVMEGSDGADAFEALVLRLADPDQSSMPIVEPAPVEVERADADIDVGGFQAAWRALTDTHDFYPMTRRFAVTRTQALRLAPEGFARVVDNGSVRRALEQASERELPIMVFVGNEGCLEIHTGPVQRIKVLGDWLNVLDPGFNLHLREDRVASSWIVRKPTTDGDVTSLELFDAQGRLIAMLFGERKPGRPEDPRWRSLAHTL